MSLSRSPGGQRLPAPPLAAGVNTTPLTLSDIIELASVC